MTVTKTTTKFESERTSRVVVCDICQASAAEGEWHTDGWYEHDEVTIEGGHKTHYPEGGGHEMVAYDCCPECFRDKVRPALEALGLRARAEGCVF